MSGRTRIEWATATWNPMTGCTPISEACEHCYALRMLGRNLPSHSGPEPTFHPDRLDVPLHWRKPRRIFVCSMSDLFHEAFTDEQRDQVFNVVARCQEHRFLVLTKRPQAMLDYMERVAALWYSVRYEGRRDSSRSAGVGDRLTGSSLAHRDATRQGSQERGRLPHGLEDESLCATQDGSGERAGLPTGSCDGRRSAYVTDGAQGRVGSSERSDSRRTDDQSQERHQVGQPAGESGDRDLLGAATACAGCSPCQETSSHRQQAPEDALDRSGCAADQEPAQVGRDGQRHRRGVWDEAQGRLGNLLPEDLETHIVWPLPNLWIGVTAENQQRADERIPILLETPAAVRFLSVEPMLGEVDLSRYLGVEWMDALDGYGHEMFAALNGQVGKLLNWVILGGETGPGARPMEPAWALDVYRQCQAAGVPFFWKRPGDYWGKEVGRAWAGDEGLAMMQTREFPEVAS